MQQYFSKFKGTLGNGNPGKAGLGAMALSVPYFGLPKHTVELSYSLKRDATFSGIQEGSLQIKVSDQKKDIVYMLFAEGSLLTKSAHIKVNSPHDFLKTALLKGNLGHRYGRTELRLQGDVNNIHNLDLDFASESAFEAEQHYVTRYGN